MNESEYYYYKLSQDKIYGDLEHEAKMIQLNESCAMNLFSILKPYLSKDGNQWCVLYGENLQEGIAGFGDSPFLAIIDFNKSFNATIPNPSI